MVTNLDGLTQEIETEKVPCGECVTTSYFGPDGELVRRDIKIVVDRGALTGAETGEKQWP